MAPSEEPDPLPPYKALTDAPGSRRPEYPRYVRWMAAAWVWSLVAGPTGFVLLCAAACIMQLRRGRVDEDIVALYLTALGSPLLCAVYREWFRRWGQRNWPSADAAEDDQTPR